MKIEVEMMKNNGGFWEKHGEFVREMNKQDNEQSQYTRENWKVFENYLDKDRKAQNTWFSWLDWVVNKSPKQVAKNSCDKILKNFPSVFGD